MSIQPSYNHTQIVKNSENTSSDAPRATTNNIEKSSPQTEQSQILSHKVSSQTTKIVGSGVSPQVLKKIVPKTNPTVQNLQWIPLNSSEIKLPIKKILSESNRNTYVDNLETLLEICLRENQDLTKTVECCENILRIDPQNRKAQAYLVQAYYKNAAYDKALAIGENLLNSRKNSENRTKSDRNNELIQCVKIIFGKIYYKGNSAVEKNYQLAQQYLAESLQYEPNNKIALSMLTNIFMRGGHGIEINDGEATRYALALHTYYPNDTNTLFYLAQIHANGGKGVNKNYKTAVDFCLKLLKQNELQQEFSNQNETLAILIQTHFLGGNGIDKDYEAAAKYAIQLIELNPKHPLAFKTLIKIYQLGGHEMEMNTTIAIRILEAYIDVILDTFPNNIDVVDMCCDILSRDLSGTELLQDLAKAYYSGTHGVSKDYKKAENYYKILMKIDPCHTQGLSALSKMYLTGGHGLEINYREAEKVTDVLLEIDPKNNDILLKTLFLRSKIYFEGGHGIPKDYSKALYICQRILSDYKTRTDRKAQFATAWANYSLGRIFFEGSEEIPKKDDKAMKHLENLCETPNKKLLSLLPKEAQEWAKKTLSKIRFNK